MVVEILRSQRAGDGEESANASFDSQETNKHRPELHAKKDGDDHTYGREEINEGAGLGQRYYVQIVAESTHLANHASNCDTNHERREDDAGG